jgi:hypothetical protein
MLGQAREGAGNVQEIWLSDTSGRNYYPFAYSMLMGDGRQRAAVLNGSSFRNNTDLPLNEMKPQDQLYVYWALPPGIQLEAYHVGPATQPVQFTVQ